MDTELLIEVIDKLIEAVSFEINSIKSQLAGSILTQVAIYSHDHIGRDTNKFGVLSESPSLSEEDLEGWAPFRATHTYQAKKSPHLKLIKAGKFEES